jgi:ribosomal protein L7/L12
MGFLDWFSPDRKELDRLNRRLAQLEHKIDLILDHLGLESVADDSLAEIKQMLSEGRKIDAVKSYRALYPGTSLRAAKEAVEAIQTE